MKNNNQKDIEVFFLEDDKQDINAKYAVIVSRYMGRWVLCRHKQRRTYEVPGGHIEPGETPYEAAKRELYEETGAVSYTLKEVCAYGVEIQGVVNYGVLCFADIKILGDLPDMEIAETALFDSLPSNLTYPQIQPHLFDHVTDWLKNKKYKAILFDLDGTLFDNFGAMDKSITKLYNITPVFHDFTLDKFKNLYETLQEKYFDMYRNNRLTWKEQRTLRMKSLYSHFGVELDDDQAYEKFLIYLKMYESYWELYDYSYELLNTLKKLGYKIGLVTNGEINQQIKKLESQNIHQFFDCVIASSEYDFRKPDKEIFDVTLEKLGVSNGEALYVGDSVRSDICGANNAKIDSVYILREHNKDYKMDCNPDYTICSLKELLPIIKLE